MYISTPGNLSKYLGGKRVNYLYGINVNISNFQRDNNVETEPSTTL